MFHTASHYHNLLGKTICVMSPGEDFMFSADWKHAVQGYWNLVPFQEHSSIYAGSECLLALVQHSSQVHSSLGRAWETIGQTQFQVLVNVLDFGMPVQAAIEAPRFSLFAEPNFYKEGAEITVRIEDRISRELFDQLTAMEHNLRLAPSFSLGSIQAILKNEQLGTVTAGADPRRAAYAVGW